MTEIFHCGMLFDGISSDVRKDVVLICDSGLIKEIVPRASFTDGSSSPMVDWSQFFVMPGLIDVHTHLSYGNAKTEEDIDLYAPVEFRALRGAFFAKQVLASGVTSIAAPGGSGHVSSSIRDAVDTGLCQGPRVTASGPYITARQGLTDWYPSWIGAPETSIGRLVRSLDEAVEEVRRQVKDGVDMVKLALDGIQRRPDGEHIAAFTERETHVIVEEIRRLGRISVVHSRGREATLYAAKAGVDLIFHASYADDEAIEAMVKNKCTVSPSLTLLRNTMDFVRPGDPYHAKGRRAVYRREYDAAKKNLANVREAGIPMPLGTDTGFAVTPYGEWHARELQIYVEDLGFSTFEALKAATSVAASVLRPADRAKVGALVSGRRADILVLKGNPLENIMILLDREALVEVRKNGQPVEKAPMDYDPRRVSDFAMTMFGDIYTRTRVAELQRADRYR